MTRNEDEAQEQLRAEALLGVVEDDDVVWSGSPRAMFQIEEGRRDAQGKQDQRQPDR